MKTTGRPAMPLRSEGSDALEDVTVPRELRVTLFRLGEDDLVVFSFPLGPSKLPDTLSSSERQVALAMLEGLSNAAIAARRGTSARTVANQIASIFRKLEVSSRAELALRLRDLEAAG